MPGRLFGTNGVIDLKVGVAAGKDKLCLDLEKGEIGISTRRPPSPTTRRSAGSTIVRRHRLPLLCTNAKAWSALDVRTGEQIPGCFNTIPGPGEFGNDTWENGLVRDRSRATSAWGCRSQSTHSWRQRGMA